MTIDDDDGPKLAPGGERNAIHSNLALESFELEVIRAQPVRYTGPRRNVTGERGRDARAKRPAASDRERDRQGVTGVMSGQPLLHLAITTRLKLLWTAGESRAAAASRYFKMLIKCFGLQEWCFRDVTSRRASCFFKDIAADARALSATAPCLDSIFKHASAEDIERRMHPRQALVNVLRLVARCVRRRRRSGRAGRAGLPPRPGPGPRRTYNIKDGARPSATSPPHECALAVNETTVESRGDAGERRRCMINVAAMTRLRSRPRTEIRPSVAGRPALLM
ncbi:hypothetical protein EVAR_103069_1 [Eumeta japonica]|uniref:Uncharacterized protein n=1 Tax=Eumeta variegata TaxID=151549 RepID=A0A4C1WR94_EUMVA|nr:hypothetical protein EVAR_103069_1 [Eumeta japonica]